MKLVLSILLLCALVAPARAAAADAEPGKSKVCGNGVACRCNATVRGTAKLDRDLTDCGRVGLRMTSGAVLDCDGHAIRGKGTTYVRTGVAGHEATETRPVSSSEGSDYGIRIDDVSDVTVKNCTVSGFKRGIRLRGGQRVKLEANRVERNTIGIEIAGNTDSGQAIDHVVTRNHVTASEQDGIHVGSGSVRAQVLENQIIRNGQEGLYVLWCTDCVIARNVIENAGTSAIYHKHTSRAQYLDNVVRGSIVHVRGESVENLFARNVLEGSAYVFEGYTNEGYANDPGWVRVPHHNEIVGGSIAGSKFCFRFHGAHDNHARGVLTQGCKPSSAQPYGSLEPTGNTLELEQVDADWDADRVANVTDPCTDRDGDGFGDPGFPASTCPLDLCPGVWNPDQADADRDGVGDACDACPLTADPGQRDADADGTGDACDGCVDPDGDGFGTGAACPADNCPRRANADQTDADLDGVGDACDRCPSFPDPEQDGVASCGVATMAGLTPEQQHAFHAALLAFTRVETPESGLGPVFNGASCAECHAQPTVGGSSARVVTMIRRPGDGPYDPLESRGGPLIQAQGIRTPECSVPNEPVPTDSVQSRRETPPLYGLGLVEAIPDDAILALADPDDRDGDGISGRPNRVGGRLGRFGWKAEQASLRDFSAKSLVDEVGITNPVRPNEVKREGKDAPCDRIADPEDDGRHLDALVEFIRLLPPLPAVAPGERDARGAALFRETGCTGCHVDSLRTGASEVAALANRSVPAFSDFLLHDMGPQLGDGVVAGEAGANEFRTAPLWGARASAPYLHDGRAPTIEEAIALHAGEATRARDRYRALAPGDREALVLYVESL